MIGSLDNIVLHVMVVNSHDHLLLLEFQVPRPLRPAPALHPAHLPQGYPVCRVSLYYQVDLGHPKEIEE